MSTTILAPDKYYTLKGTNNMITYDFSALPDNPNAGDHSHGYDSVVYLGTDQDANQTILANQWAVCVRYPLNSNIINNYFNTITIPCAIYLYGGEFTITLSTEAPSATGWAVQVWDGSTSNKPTTNLASLYYYQNVNLSSLTFNINNIVSNSYLYVYVQGIGYGYGNFPNRGHQETIGWRNGGGASLSYIPSEYTVSYNANGGNSTPGSQTVSAGAAVTLPAAITRTTTSNNYTTTFNANSGNTTKSSQSATHSVAYAFNGWHENSASGATHAAGSSFTPTSSITMYAGWDETVTNTGITFPTASECTRSGYTLIGFALSSSATQAEYSPGDNYAPTADETFYAVWCQTATYMITYHGNGGVCNIAPTPKEENVAVTISNLIPTKTGYAFIGWSTVLNDVVAYQPEDSYNVNANLDLYAVWALQNLNFVFINGVAYNVYVHDGINWIQRSPYVYSNGWIRCGENDIVNS